MFFSVYPMSAHFPHKNPKQMSEAALHITAKIESNQDVNDRVNELANYGTSLQWNIIQSYKRNELSSPEKT